MPRTKNLARWRLIPSEKTVAEGCFDRGFSNKAMARAWQKRIENLFPDELCALCDTGRHCDALERIYETKE